VTRRGRIASWRLSNLSPLPPPSVFCRKRKSYMRILNKETQKYSFFFTSTFFMLVI